MLHNQPVGTAFWGCPDSWVGKVGEVDRTSIPLDPAGEDVALDVKQALHRPDEMRRRLPIIDRHQPCHRPAPFRDNDALWIDVLQDLEAVLFELGGGDCAHRSSVEERIAAVPRGANC